MRYLAQAVLLPALFALDAAAHEVELKDIRARDWLGRQDPAEDR